MPTIKLVEATNVVIFRLHSACFPLVFPSLCLSLLDNSQHSSMASLSIFRSLIFSQLLLLVLAQVGKCPPSFACGTLGTIKFPFTNTQRPHCGVLAIHGCDDQNPEAPKSILPSNTPTQRFNVVEFLDSHTLTITDGTLRNNLRSKSCKAFSNNFTLPPSSPLGSFYVKYNITLLRCNHSLNVTLPHNVYNYTKCSEYNIYYHGPPDNGDPRDFLGPSSLTTCSKIQLPIKDQSDTNDPFSFLSGEVDMVVQLSGDCSKCIDHERGQCQLDSQGKLSCVEGSRSWVVMKMGLGIGLGNVNRLLPFFSSVARLS